MYHEHDILIDLGTGFKNVFQECNSKRKIIISLSHAHKDHISGLSYLSQYYDRLDSVWLPRYYDQVIIFIDFILRLKGIKKIPFDYGLLIRAKQSINVSRLLSNISSVTSRRMIGFYQGLSVCNHIEVLNPQYSVEENLSIREEVLDNYIEGLKKTGYAELKEWFDDKDFNRIGASILSEGWSDNITPLLEQEDLNNSLRMIHGLIYKHRENIASFVKRPTLSTFRKLFLPIEKDMNNLSLILHYADDKSNILFTGDATISVFENLIKKGILPEVDTLKIPHHGSKKSLTKDLLKFLNPKTAIISHNNGKFGRQVDPHPNREVINWLKSLQVDTLYTNDVIKKGVIIRNQSKRDFNSEIELIV